MAEPQPSSISEGAADPHAPTGTAEDRKAAAALESLDAQEDGGEKKDVDNKALDKAMKGLNVKDKKGEEKKIVKVEAADVALLVAELELSKQKATELLRGNDGDAVKAMAAFVTT
ncbi:uncharacterized protein K460DRAFT_369844 [Cucurbitaria berberidis CBS 394.84]|uniref:Nascent polypeptide-associated complex subunit alpha-like UBA domain-containing protein n=1 Tax=Cucurbitaria berberidis CBS 394.84 TaxID=1168544 RepID=A0A9P4GA40_9PLEO|nr:uncharacterized protein K460DRAFT_369844 [Cucurbitaria berberidis CBS 394.84]KAF1841832.1 hypothetical protein K460DRAFT_369844 [Cucurbitaria berberidis CBS 394.84]